MIDPCPRCGDLDGDCYQRKIRHFKPSMFPSEADIVIAPDWQARLACSTTVIAREFKRLNDFMESGAGDEDRPTPPDLRPLCPYCGTDEHLAGSPASDRCRERIEREAPLGLGTDGQL